MRFCKRCVEPDTRPDCAFDEEGVCVACRHRERMATVDWGARHKELQAIADWARATTKSQYHCMVPISGGKDSHRQALWVRDELGLKPLLVTCAYPPQQQTERGAANLANMVELGFDTYVISPAPKTWKEMYRIGFIRHGNLFRSSELALYACAPRVAVAYNIPLLVYGENPTLSWGAGAGGSLTGEASMIRNSDTIRGGMKEWLDAGIPEDKLYWYEYPPQADIERANIRMIYLGYFIEGTSGFDDFTNARTAIAAGLTTRHGLDAKPEEIGSILDFEVLDEDFVIVNQMLKYLKFGFGKVTENASGAIRNGMLTRERAVELVRMYDGRCANRYIERLCDYLEITGDEFWQIAERHRNPKIWERGADGTWQTRFAVYKDQEAPATRAAE